MQDMINLEEQGWQALSTGVEASKKFYSSVLRDDAVMLFPGGMLIEGKENILQSLAAQPWKSFQIEEPRVISLSDRFAQQLEGKQVELRVIRRMWSPLDPYNRLAPVGRVTLGEEILFTDF